MIKIRGKMIFSFFSKIFTPGYYYLYKIKRLEKNVTKYSNRILIKFFWFNFRRYKKLDIFNQEIFGSLKKVNFIQKHNF